MKKFFDEYPIPVLLAFIVGYSVPAYYVLQITYSMLANGDDPALVFFASSVMACISLLIIIPFVPVLCALSIVFELIGWLIKQLFFAARYLLKRRRTHNPA